MRQWTGILILLVIVAIVSPAIGSGIIDFPEANPWPALESKEDQRIWHRPGQLVTEVMAWPITRFTLTIYNDDLGQGEGFITLTHQKPGGGEQVVTFYYNVKVIPQKRAVVSFAVTPGMWEEGFIGLAPRAKQPVADLLSKLPDPTRMLWILPPLEGHVVREGEQFFLSLVLGGPGLNGLMTLPLTGIQNFPDEQKGRRVKVWGAQVSAPTTIKWTRDGLKGQFEWRPGMAEPILRKDEVWM